MAIPTSKIPANGKIRIGLVLSCGGLRGAAHLGVLRQLNRHKIPIDVMVGVSAGAIIAGFYAAAGLTAEEMIGDAPTFRGRHVILQGLAARVPASLKPFLLRQCGVVPTRLAQLDAARFDHLHHGVQRLGIVCHDVYANRPVYFSTLNDRGVAVAQVVKGSAAVPVLLPTTVVTIDGERRRLTDGGLTDSLPIAFARSEELGATHLIVSDCRVYGRPTREDDSTSDVVSIRPDLTGIGSFRSPRTTLMAAVHAGESAVTDKHINDIRAWLTRTRLHAVGT